MFRKKRARRQNKERAHFSLLTGLSFQNAPILDSEAVQDLKQYVQDHGTLSEDYKDISVPYVIIRGSVQAAKTSLHSHYFQDIQGVIRQFSVTEHKRSLSRAGFWYDSSRTIQTSSNAVPFYIGQVLVDHENAYELDLEVTYDKFDPAPNSLGDHVWGWVVGDRSKGVSSTEKMLVNNTELTAIGELVKTGDKLTLQAPENEDFYLIKDTPKALIKKLEGGSSAIKVCLMIFSGLGLAIGAYAGYKYYKKWKEWKDSQRSRDTLRTIIDNRQSDNHHQEQLSSPLSEHQYCVVCLGQQREVILLDCGHVCVCANCAAEIMRTTRTCPVCRAYIERVAPAYIS